jgi:hypothetical protein
VSRLERDGINARTLKPGDIVRIWASPNRNPNDSRIRLKRIERRADRWKWGGQNRNDNRDEDRRGTATTAEPETAVSVYKTPDYDTRSQCRDPPRVGGRSIGAAGAERGY